MTVTDHRSTGPTDVDGGRGDGAWAVLLPAGRYDAERLVHHEPGADPPGRCARPTPRRPGGGAGRRAAPAGGAGPGDPPDGQTLLVTYTRRSFDTPVPVGSVAVDRAGQRPRPGHLPRAGRPARPAAARRTWLVSLDLPIEAESQAEAVRLFWSYVRELGPAELPAFVSPSGDELAMQAFVLGVEANQDPEEDD